MTFRRVNRIIHRDLGYICVGLTLVYALTGILLNHIHDFNSNYSIKIVTEQLSPGEAAGLDTEEGVARVLNRLGETRPARAVFQPDPDTMQIFVEGSVVDVGLRSGTVTYEKAAPRPLLKFLNDLHLNNKGRAWTWFSDLYAAALGLLAITGLFVLTGRKGITGRGAWLTALGVILPVLLLLVF
jgi:hypothetical protein